jgi:signal transduction histidine kinase
MDADQTIPEVAALAARQIADGCVALVLGPAGASWSFGHPDPLQAERGAQLLRGAAPEELTALGVPTVLSTGEPLVRHRLAAPDRGDARVGAALMRDLRVRAALAVPLHARGQALGAIVLLSSARRARFSDEDVQLAEDLARLVSSAIEASRLYRRAQEAVAARDEFLSIASHELKTPLTSLVLHTDSLRAAARRGTLAQAANKVELIRRSVDRLSRLVTSLLDISRISAGRLDLEVEEVDLAEVAREVVARFDEEAVRAGCTLVVNAHAVAGRWDRMRMDQVITNLLANAVKYGPGKPVMIRVEPDGDRAILSVRDHGIGISEDDQRRIFQRFERAVSKRNYGGFGLGLWIVRQIVEALGGSVRVESTPGQGSLFTVELARGLHAATPAEGRARPTAPSP